MLFLMVLLLLTKISTLILAQSVGSVLFYKRDIKDCWTRDELAKLRARKIFEDSILPCPPPDKINVKYNKNVLKYFRRAIKIAKSNKDPYTAKILGDAISDAVGGHMRSKLLPNTKFAYYAGYVPYRSVKQLHDFYKELKLSLNTQGLGWKESKGVPSQSNNMTVGKILIGAGNPFDPCSSLIVQRYNNNCIRIPAPQVDDESSPTALALPFKSGGFVSLSSPSSENILLNFYTTATRCILQSSPAECRHADFVNFNNELWHWMKRYVAPHLMDEQLYAAYGGVLRIAAAVQNYGKGLSRRNLFQSEPGFGDSNWYKLKCMLDKRFYVDANWTPPMALMMVLSAALAMCFLHLMYTYLCGSGGGCHCPKRRSGRPTSAHLEDAVYAVTDSGFPAMLPAHPAPRYSEDAPYANPVAPRYTEDARYTVTGAPRYSDEGRYVAPAPTPRLGSTSISAARQQRVYDFNENAERIMSVLMSDEDSGTSSNYTEDENTVNKTLVGTGNRNAQAVRSPQRSPKSPPKIDAQMAQLKIEKNTTKSPRGDRVQLYTASTVSQSEITYGGEQGSDTAWSGSYTSEQSVTSVTTKSLRRTR